MKNKYADSSFRQRSNPVINKNVSWMNTSATGAFLGYCSIIAAFAWISILTLPFDTAWTVVNLSHFVATFYLFHWRRGTPVRSDQGAYDDKTFWEQMDDGVPWTESKKVLFVAPVVLWIIGSHANQFSMAYFMITAVPLCTLLFAKIPEFDGVRLFGLNKFKE